MQHCRINDQPEFSSIVAFSITLLSIVPKDGFPNRSFFIHVSQASEFLGGTVDFKTLTIR